MAGVGGGSRVAPGAHGAGAGGTPVPGDALEETQPGGGYALGLGGDTGQGSGRGEAAQGRRAAPGDTGGHRGAPGDTGAGARRRTLGLGQGRCGGGAGHGKGRSGQGLCDPEGVARDSRCVGQLSPALPAAPRSAPVSGSSRGPLSQLAPAACPHPEPQTSRPGPAAPARCSGVSRGSSTARASPEPSSRWARRRTRSLPPPLPPHPSAGTSLHRLREHLPPARCGVTPTPSAQFLPQAGARLGAEGLRSPCSRYSSKNMAVSPTSSSGPWRASPGLCLARAALHFARWPHSAPSHSYLPALSKTAATAAQCDLPASPELLQAPWAGDQPCCWDKGGLTPLTWGLMSSGASRSLGHAPTAATPGRRTTERGCPGLQDWYKPQQVAFDAIFYCAHSPVVHTPPLGLSWGLRRVFCAAATQSEAAPGQTRLAGCSPLGDIPAAGQRGA